MLKKKYLLAKCGLDKADKDTSKVWSTDLTPRRPFLDQMKAMHMQDAKWPQNVRASRERFSPSLRVPGEAAPDNAAGLATLPVPGAITAASVVDRLKNPAVMQRTFSRSTIPAAERERGERGGEGERKKKRSNSKSKM